MSFDPWTATFEEAESQADAHEPHGAVLRWGAALEIKHRREWYEDHPMDGVAACVQAGLVAPDWLARAFLRRYYKVVNCDAATWGEAFGPAHYVEGAHLSTLKLRRTYGWQVNRLFSGPARLPRTNDGYARASELTGLTPKQIRTLLPKTRTNTKGHKPYGSKVRRDGAALTANNPFGLPAKKPK